MCWISMNLSKYLPPETFHSLKRLVPSPESCPYHPGCNQECTTFVRFLAKTVRCARPVPLLSVFQRKRYVAPGLYHFCSFPTRSGTVRCAREMNVFPLTPPTLFLTKTSETSHRKQLPYAMLVCLCSARQIPLPSDVQVSC